MHLRTSGLQLGRLAQNQIWLRRPITLPPSRHVDFLYLLI